MFTRIVKTKKKNNTYKYLKLIENYWENGSTKQRVVGNFGNIEKLDVKKVDSAIASLAKYSSGYFKDIRKLNTLEVKDLGEVLAGEKFWQTLQLDDILNRFIPDTHLDGNTALLIKIMVLSRLVEPVSKLKLSEKYRLMAIPELEDKLFQPHHFYLAMDELIQHKEKIETALHEKEKDLFSMNLNMVFYDLTSSCFEGESCPLAKHGYSRDHRRDLKQVVIGLLVTDQGLPIAHQVYPGNTKDSTTMTGQVGKMKETFGIKNCVFVVDRGMVTEKNLEELVNNDYQYIVALRKRKRDLFQPVLGKGKKLLQPVEGQNDLSGFETKLSEFGPDKVFFFFNPQKADVESLHRHRRLQKAEAEIMRIQDMFISKKRKNKEKLLQQAARYLGRKKLVRFFTLAIDDEKGINYELNKNNIDFEAELDGLFVLRTNRNDLSISEVVSAYKTLARAESAFKELKDFIDLRPMYHWAEERVKAHIFICILSYLIEICMEIRMKEKKLEMTARKALDHLSEIKLVYQQVEEMNICTYSQPSVESRKIIDALGLKLPKEKLFVEK